MIRRLARGYFAVQAVAGALWWIAVFVSADVRRWTLGGWPAAWLVGPDLLLFVGGSALVAVTARRWALVVVTLWTTVVAVGLMVYATATGRAGWGALLMAAATVGSIGAAATLWHGRVPTDRVLLGPLGFGVAPERSRRSNVGHSLAQLVFFWTSFLLVLPLVLTWFERRWRISWPALVSDPPTLAAIVVFAVGSVLGLWSCLTMATLGRGTPLPSVSARELVVAGPYRWLRNPMAVAGALQTIGVGSFTGSWLVLTAAVAGAIAWHGLIRPLEEADLRARFGASYDNYRRQVRCWLPIRVKTRDQSEVTTLDPA